MDHLEDNDVLAKVSGALAGEAARARRLEIEAHLDGCAACRDLVSASAAASIETAKVPSSEPAQPASERAQAGSRAQRLGRYFVLHPLGAGAMGVVYAAYDPELDRRVALKLLHAAVSNAPALKVRLLAEAQAMARLSHPNVIAVHDVGTVDDQVFVAMDLVEGKTLGAWVASGAHSWREILRVFILAGRGLAAAHAAGIVHRDFKPENVLVGNDGRVRVTDFGLARAEARESGEPAGPGLIEPHAQTAVRPITQAGALVGSPPYMSPEQIRGEKVDARADQFSFAVALHGALYGERPYAGENLRELLREIEAQRVRPEPAGARVPRWVRRALLRGLASNAGDRFPSLSALLDALERDPLTRWRRLGAVASAIALIGCAVLFMRWQTDRKAQVCRGAEKKLENVWDDSLRAKTKAAFAATQLSYAGATFALAAQELDRYARDWIAMRTDACEATAVRRQQTSELLDLRMACLDDRLRSLRAVVAVLSTADKDVIVRATQMASGLALLDGCANEAALRTVDAPTPAQLVQVNALRDQLARANALGDAGKAPVQLAQETSDAAAKLGYAPLEAQALLSLGLIQQQAGDVKAAQRTLLAATAAALRAKLDAVLAEAWTSLLDVDIELPDIDGAASAARQAKAAESRLSGDARQHAQLLIALGDFARFQASDMDEAQRYCEEAVAVLEKDPNPSNVGLSVQVLGDLGLTLQGRALWPQALAALQQAFAKSIAHYGAEHPITAEMEEGLGGVLTQRGQFAEAQPHLEHALAVIESALGPDHPAVADVLRDLANNYLYDDPARAAALLRRSLRILHQHLGDDSTGNIHSLLGSALQLQGQLEPARKEFEAAMAISLKASHNPDDLDWAMAATELGALLAEEGKAKLARSTLEAALAVQLKGFRPEHPQIGDTLIALADLELSQRHLPAARRDAEQALRISRLDLPGDSVDNLARELLLAKIEIAGGHEDEARASLERIAALPERAPGADGPNFDRALARSLLARALWPDAKSRPRALQLAAAAKAEYATRGARDLRDRAELKQWLLARGK